MPQDERWWSVKETTPAMEERIETVELDANRWITLEFAREWPKYVVTWSIRRKVGDGDFPAGTGRVERMPPRGDETVESVLEALRGEAISDARAAAESDAGDEARRRPGGLIRRLFNRT
jgi:hypothetical protein